MQLALIKLTKMQRVGKKIKGLLYSAGGWKSNLCTGDKSDCISLFSSRVDATADVDGISRDLSR